MPQPGEGQPAHRQEFGSEYDVRRAAKGAPKDGRRKGVSGLEGEGDGEGQEDAGVLDEDVVFVDSALDGSQDVEGDFYAMSLGMRGSSFSVPRLFDDALL